MSVRRAWNIRLAQWASLLFLMALASAALAVGPVATVDGIRCKSANGHTRVVVDLSSSASFEYKRINGPDRLFIDFKRSAMGKGVKRKIALGDGLLRGIRASQYSFDTVRVVLDLEKVNGLKVHRLTGPPRVVVDVYGDRPGVSTRRVVLDAGHGGRDPGAIGPGGIKEKDIVLDVARRVKRLLEKEVGYEVFLTRSRDVYLDLEKRTTIANRKKADLFVSIHLNANRRRSAKGLETYLLNWTDNEEAIRVAARENMISERRMRQARSEVGVILASLSLQNKKEESFKLAHYVQDSMIASLERKYGRVEDHGVKHALFYVLVGAEMPSVLVEGSFITNYQEARRLRTKTYREYLARGIAAGIKTYFARSGPVQEIAQR
jgi:N-acetylmuramoyl-L-alanine amidase